MSTNDAPTSYPTSPPRTLVRARDGRMLAGVCAGIANYLGIDVTVVRLITAVLSLVGGGGVIAYLVAWLLIPEEGASKSEAARLADRFTQRR